MSDLILAGKLYFAWILLLLLFLLVGYPFFGDSNNITLLSLANWDGRHFLDIAKFGYTNNIQYAFFPLYPSLIKIVSTLFNGNYLFAGLLINFFSTFGIVYIFLKLLQKSAVKIKTLTYFLLFPTSFYLISVYTESLFLLFTLISFFALQKKKTYLAVSFAALASLTRISGVAVIAAILFEILLSKISVKQKILHVFISSSGLLLYCSYLYLNTGNPFYFLISELDWDRAISFPGLNIITAISFLASYGLKPESFTILSDLLFTVFGIGLAIRVWKNLKPSYSIYTILSLYLPLATALILSMPRFLIVIFPLFIVLAQIKSRIFNVSYLIISVSLLFLYFNFFLRVIWVS